MGTVWRWLLFAGLLVVIAWGMPSRTGWNMIANSTSNGSVTELLIPGYLLLLVRDLRHPWEALVGTRLGSARRWWDVQVLVAGAAAVMLVVAMVIVFCVLSLLHHPWSWHWNTNSTQLVGGHVVATWSPWVWSVDALGLMTAGFWATGALWTVCALWWRSPWLAWLIIVALNLVPLSFVFTPLAFLVWVLPGPQFAWIQHGTAFPHSPASTWSLGYAAVLLGLTTLGGGRLVRLAPWDARHGEPMG